MLIFKEFNFDAAHFLPNVPEGHKCREIHGHTYRLKVCIEGQPDPHEGWIIDFSEVKRIVAPVVEQLDHKFLNNVEELKNPTCELLCIWLWQKIKPLLPVLKRLELMETPTSGAIYEG